MKKIVYLSLMLTLLLTSIAVAAPVGNLNINIDIQPYQKIVQSGKSVMFKVSLKITGAFAQYNNAVLVITMPKKEYTAFSQDVSNLAVGGIIPIYNLTDGTLTYSFGTLEAGQVLETVISIDTLNGLTPDGAELIATASFTADGIAALTDIAVVKMEAGNTINVTKQFISVNSNQSTRNVPFPDAGTLWEIKVAIPKSAAGQMYLREGTMITITDTLPNGLTYSTMAAGGGPVPTQSGNQLTWKFTAPTIEEQQSATDMLFTTTLRVWLKVPNNMNLVNTTQTNTVSVIAFFIDGMEKSSPQAQGSIYVVDKAKATETPAGTYWVPAHYGPTDGNGNFSNNNNLNPNPSITDKALLQFRFGINSHNLGQFEDFRSFNVVYQIDPKLVFKELFTPGDWVFRPTTDYSAGIPLRENPAFNIWLTVNGTERLVVTDAQHATTYTLQMLGLSEEDQVTRVRYQFTYAPAGLYTESISRFYFYIKPGTSGTAANTIRWYGTRGNGTNFDITFNTVSHTYGSRSATIVPPATPSPPIGSISIELMESHNGEVVYGTNRAMVRFSNLISSTTNINKPLQAVVLLPAGTSLASASNTVFSDADGRTSNSSAASAGGQLTLLDSNYNGTNQQLVLVQWNDWLLRPGSEVQAEFDVVISKSTPSSVLIFDVYGYSSDADINVATGSGLKSGNRYVIRGLYDIQTTLSVKGSLDSSFSSMGKSEPGGDVQYKLMLTNTTGKAIDSMTLIDVLPSVGDLGITDHKERRSQFSLKMKGPITLPSEWAEKVNVFYSTTANPAREELISNTIYPKTAVVLSSPPGAMIPVWLTAGEISDWSEIYSYKLELKDGIDWVLGQQIEVQWTMQAPEAHEVAPALLDKEVLPALRAAWNSFAVATDHGQPVEPYAAGVYMDSDIDSAHVEKTVNDKVVHQTTFVYSS